MNGARWAIDIDRDAIDQAAIVAQTAPILAEGEVEVAVDLFAMTANNVTYALFGKPAGLFGNDQGYWDFFAERGAPGRLPVWGFATVTASRAHGVAVGERYYGYYPMASHAVLRPARIGRGGFTDATPRRTTLPGIYNQYRAIDALDDYRADHHDWWPVFRPLFLTGWLIADQLADEGDYGAAQVLIASASSKTAIGLAHCLQRRQGPRAASVGLTSAGNVAAVTATGLYDRVVAYDAIDTLDAGTASVLVDMAGSGAVTGAVHRHFGDALRASIVVGKSHWDAAAEVQALPGPPRQGFFAPARSDKRIADWGGAEFARVMATDWLAFMDIAPGLARLDRRDGAEGALAAYRAMLGGGVDAAAALLVAP